MPLGMEVRLGPGDFVLDGDPAPLNFRPMFIMAALCNGAGHYIFALWFLSSVFFSLSFFFSSPNLSGRRLDVYHTLTHGVALVRI